MKMDLDNNMSFQTISIPASEIISPEHSIKSALAEIQQTRSIRAVIQSSERIESVVSRLAKLLTHVYPDGAGGHVLSSAINAAYEAYAKASESLQNASETESVFMEVAVENAAMSALVDVHGVNANKTSELWPLYSIPLHDWVRRKSFVTLQFSPCAVRRPNQILAARLSLATHIIGMDSPTLILRSAQAVAGNVGA